MCFNQGRIEVEYSVANAAVENHELYCFRWATFQNNERSDRHFDIMMHKPYTLGSALLHPELKQRRLDRLGAVISAILTRGSFAFPPELPQARPVVGCGLRRRSSQANDPDCHLKHLQLQILVRYIPATYTTAKAYGEVVIMIIFRVS
jgi:hypothetical protein